MKADVKLTAYDKLTQLIKAAVSVPPALIGDTRRIAGVPASDPDLRGVYPLTADQIAQIAAKIGLTLDPEGYDYCLEAFLPQPRAQQHAGLPRTRKERAKANAARARNHAATGST